MNLQQVFKVSTLHRHNAGQWMDALSAFVQHCAICITDSAAHKILL